MKRQIVYPGAIPFDTDLLNAQKNSLEGIGKLAHALLGDGPFVNNLQCTPTAPASMAVQVAPGQIYQLLAIDSGTYGALAADSHTILKQGLLRDAVTLNCPAPTTSGQSINYLVQAQYVDQDGNPAILPYYNSANPAQSLNGPNNNGQAQNTSRDGACVVSIKAGASAPTGSQVTPAVDSGCVGLYVITVGYGATTVTTVNISTYAGAPFIAEKLKDKISTTTGDARYLQTANFQAGSPNYAPDTGTANNYQVAYTPAITTLTDGMKLRYKAKTANTGASTFSPNGVAASPIWSGAHAALLGGEIVANGDVELIWNSSLNGGAGAWVILESTGGFIETPTPAQFDNSNKLATTAFLKQMGLQMGGQVVLAASTTLTAAAHAGKFIVLNASNIAATLPAAASVPAGTVIAVLSQGTGNSIATASGDHIGFGTSNSTSVAMTSSDTAILQSDGTSFWNNVGGSALLGYSGQFNKSLATSGYQVLPGGLILQWVYSTIATSGVAQNQTLPITFPNACLAVIGGSNSNNSQWAATKINTSTISVWSNNAGATGCTLAIGY